MTIAVERLEAIREQVQMHLDNAAEKQLSPQRKRELTELI